jgi:two-component system KDP operon response regulator KdpE
VTVAERDTELVVTVTDHGPGIAVDRREEVFEPFRSGGPGRDRAWAWPSVGPSSRPMEVTISAGDAPGGGAAVSFSLPSTADEVDAGVGASILIVDDERPLLRVLSAGLEAKGYRTRTAPTGAKALEAAAVAEPDVTLLDLGCPTSTASTSARGCAAPRATRSSSSTADGAEDRKIRALDEGADDYVTKPFSLPELLARIRVALRPRRALIPSAPGAPETIIVGTLIIDVDAHMALLDGAELRLTRKELAVLGLLARNAGACSPIGPSSTRCGARTSRSTRCAPTSHCCGASSAPARARRGS